MDIGTKERGDARLSFLMEEAIRTCNELYRYASDHFSVFEGDDGDRIAEAVDGRKPIVEALVELESQIDALTAEADGGEEKQTGRPPYTVEEFRGAARAILDKVTELDLEAMERVGQKMQKYKEKTLKLRNRKNLSLYIRAGAMTRTDSPYDSQNMTLFD